MTIMILWLCSHHKYMPSLYFIILTLNKHRDFRHIVRDRLALQQSYMKLLDTLANTKAPALWSNKLNQKETFLSHVSSVNPALYTDTQGFKG